MAVSAALGYTIHLVQNKLPL